MNLARWMAKPVHTLFTLISPTTRAHLHLISRLAFALRDPKFYEVVLRKGLREEILREAKRVESSFAGPNPVESEQSK